MRTKEQRAAYQREWRAKNKEKYAAYQREWRAKNKERAAAISKKSGRTWRAANIEAARRHSREWYARNAAAVLSKRRAKKYGIAPEQLEQLCAAAQGRCAICFTPTADLHVDHDHTTGKVRGMLCHSCNTGLGHFRDDRRNLYAAIRYLENT